MNNNLPFDQKKLFGHVKAAMIGVFVGCTILGTFNVIPEGTRGVKLRNGEAIDTVSTGLQFKLPYIERIDTMSVMADSVAIENSEGATKDTQPVHTNLVVRYRIVDKHVLDVYKEFSKTGDMDSYVETASQEAFKAVTAKYSADELINKRNEVTLAVNSAIQQKVTKYGIEILNIDMTKFGFSTKYMDAINSKVTEEQQKLAEENKLERIKVEQQQKVVSAKAEAEAAVAEARGKAEAMHLESIALRENMNILEMRRIEVQKIQAERWDGKLPATMLGSAVPMINMDSK